MALIDLHIHVHGDTAKLDTIITQNQNIIEIMAKTKADFDQQLARIEAGHTAIAESLANVADDVRRLTEGMTPTGGLTEAEATEIFDSVSLKADAIDALATQIRELADKTPEQPTEPQP